MPDRTIADVLGALGIEVVTSDRMPRNAIGFIPGGLDTAFSPFLRTGRVLRLGHTVLIGTGPWNDLDVAGERARRIVRHGLADVLAWLGQDVGPAPDDPYPFADGL